jgi:hypothetical protein
VRRRYFRAILLKLECGHIHEYVTSSYRLHPVTVALLIGQLIRKGIWCQQGCGLCQPVGYLGTCRADEEGI